MQKVKDENSALRAEVVAVREELRRMTMRHQQQPSAADDPHGKVPSHGRESSASGAAAASGFSPPGGSVSGTPSAASRIASRPASHSQTPLRHGKQ